MTITAVNGFRGDVTLEFLNLPAGVTSQMPESVTITDDTLCCYFWGIPQVGVTLPVSLKASSAAALGTAPVVLRATSGSIVHTIDLSITVHDELPPTTLRSVLWEWSSRTGGDTVRGFILLDKPAPSGGVVITLTSSDPVLAPVPASVTIPEGATSGQFFVSTGTVETSA